MWEGENDYDRDRERKYADELNEPLVKSCNMKRIDCLTKELESCSDLCIRKELHLSIAEEFFRIGAVYCAKRHLRVATIDMKTSEVDFMEHLHDFALSINDGSMARMIYSHLIHRCCLHKDTASKVFVLSKMWDGLFFHHIHTHIMRIVHHIHAYIMLGMYDEAEKLEQRLLSYDSDEANFIIALLRLVQNQAATGCLKWFKETIADDSSRKDVPKEMDQKSMFNHKVFDRDARRNVYVQVVEMCAAGEADVKLLAEILSPYNNYTIAELLKIILRVEIDNPRQQFPSY